MARLPTPGSDNGVWGNLLNDFLGVEHNQDGTLKASGTLAGKADDDTVIHTSGAESVGGVKTFTSSPIVPTPSSATQATNKQYVDDAVIAGAPDATTSSKGIVQLAGDLGGTATNPTVPGLTDKVNASTTISAGTGLAGGGDLTTNRTISANFGTTSGTITEGNDTRLTNAVQSTIVDAKGDLIVASAADTLTRLGAGSNGQVLTADSTQATGVKWNTLVQTSNSVGNGYVGLGDSISSVTGGAGYGGSWTIMAPALSMQKLNYLANAGVSGNNTTQMLARLSTDVIAHAPQVCTILGGTNDLAQSVTLATYQSNITSITTQLRAANILPVLCTIPPRGNTTHLTNTIKWNNWLRYYARQQGVPLIDFFTLLVDPATGVFLSGYDSGDALHPSQAAHVEMAKLVNTELGPYIPPYSPLRAVSNTGDTDNLMSNPFMINGTPTPTSYVASGSSMTGYTEQLVTDADFLGKAWEFNFTNPSNAAGFRQLTQTLAGGSWSVGNTLLFVIKFKVVSQSGVTPANNVGLRMTASFFSSSTPTVTFVPGNVTVYGETGLYWFRHVVPASTTSVALNAGVFSIPTTGQLTARVGEFAVFNLTSLGLT